MPQLPLDDFRLAAVIASEAMPVALRSVTPDPVTMRWSCCMLAPEDGLRVKRRAARVIAVSMVFFGLGLSAGGIIALGLKMKYPNVNAIPARPLLFAGACTLTGFAIGIAGMTAKRIMVMRHLRDRIGASQTLGADKPMPVTIENAATFEKIKLSPEDSGVLIPHPDVGCVRIEGLVCRYIIHAKDVRAVTRVKGPNSEAVGLDYAIGNIPLRIAVQPMGIGAELKRQLLRRKSALCGVVCRAFGKSEREFGL